jgi:hypothetical protein
MGVSQTVVKLYWHILAEVRAFGGLSDYDTLYDKVSNPADSEQIGDRRSNRCAGQLYQHFR